MSNESIERALLLEDNAVIALDTEMLIHDLGVPNVVVASDVAEARTAIESNPIQIAFLDINLGDETSEPIAEILTQRGVPFAFVTGYGEASDFVSRFPKAPIIEKPFDEADLQIALNELKSQLQSS